MARPSGSRSEVKFKVKVQEKGCFKVKYKDKVISRSKFNVEVISWSDFLVMVISWSRSSQRSSHLKVQEQGRFKIKCKEKVIQGQRSRWCHGQSPETRLFQRQGHLKVRFPGHGHFKVKSKGQGHLKITFQEQDHFKVKCKDKVISRSGWCQGQIAGTRFFQGQRSRSSQGQIPWPLSFQGKNVTLKFGRHKIVEYVAKSVLEVEGTQQKSYLIRCIHLYSGALHVNVIWLKKDINIPYFTIFGIFRKVRNSAEQTHTVILYYPPLQTCLWHHTLWICPSCVKPIENSLSCDYLQWITPTKSWKYIVTMIKLWFFQMGIGSFNMFYSSKCYNFWSNCNLLQAFDNIFLQLDQRIIAF